MYIFTLAFWSYAGERSIKTVAQSALAVFGVGVTGILDVDWAGVGSIAALAGVVSVLTSVIGYTPPAGDHAAPATYDPNAH